MHPLLKSVSSGIIAAAVAAVIQPWRWLAGPRLLYQFRVAYWRRTLGTLGLQPFLGRNMVIRTPEEVRVGDFCSLGDMLHVWGGGGVVIGDRVLIAAHVTITSLTHDPDVFPYRDSVVAKPIVIEADAWIGSNAVILPGVRIGRGAIIGAGSIVTRDVPPMTVAVGAPARVIRTLSGARQAPSIGRG